MKRSGPLKRRSPMARGRGVKPVNRERRAEQHSRNFGAEADAVRAMPCAAGVALLKMGHRAQSLGIEQDRGSSMMMCSGKAAAAHVTARGMGAAKGGRFDLVPLCAAHHEEAGEARSSKRAAFEQRYGLDLRRLADDIALGMPEPLGIRGLARRFAAMRTGPFCAGDGAKDGWFHMGSGHRIPQVLDDYEAGALFGWVDRRAERVWAEQPGAIGESAVLAVLVSELGLTIEAAGDLLDAATEGRP